MGNSLGAPPAGGVGSAKREFDELISSNPVMIFSTTTCPYCQVAKRTFKEMGTTFNAIELNKVDNGREIATELYQVSQQKTVFTNCDLFYPFILEFRPWLDRLFWERTRIN